MDHFVDAVDRNGATELVFRSGATKSIEPGSWIVNCTGYVVGRDHPYEPYISDSGKVLSIQLRSATLHLSSFGGYFLTHLLMLEKLREVPLYELDGQELLKKSHTAFPYTLLTLASVPTKVFSECGLDFERWYPLPRRMIGMAKFMLTHRRAREHMRQSLDTVHERFGVRCGPLVQAAREVSR